MWFRGTWLGGKPALLDAASVPRLAAACREMSTREWSMFNEDVAAQMTTARHESDTPPRDSAASLVAEIAARVPAELVPLWKRHGQDVMMTTTLPALTELVAASLTNQTTPSAELPVGAEEHVEWPLTAKMELADALHRASLTDVIDDAVAADDSGESLAVVETALLALRVSYFETFSPLERTASQDDERLLELLQHDQRARLDAATAAAATDAWATAAPADDTESAAHAAKTAWATALVRAATATAGTPAAAVVARARAALRFAQPTEVCVSRRGGGDFLSPDVVRTTR